MTLQGPPFRPPPPYGPACIKVIAECHPFLQRQRPSKATSPLYDLGIRLTCDLLLSISFASWNHIKWRNIGFAKTLFKVFHKMLQKPEQNSLANPIHIDKRFSLTGVIHFLLWSNNYPLIQAGVILCHRNVPAQSPVVLFWHFKVNALIALSELIATGHMRPLI